jgi:cytochrome c-type biogenesis protein
MLKYFSWIGDGMPRFLKSKRAYLQHTVNAVGIFLIIIEVLTIMGWESGTLGYINSLRLKSLRIGRSESITVMEQVREENRTFKNTDVKKKPVIPAYDFTLTDQYGKEHTLSDYKGQVVFLNFWASWCPPCKKEMPYIEELYKEYNKNKEEVVFLGIANPKSKENQGNQDEKKEELMEFIDSNGLTFPILFDETGEILNNYYISAFPTTFMIDKKGNVFGYVSGMMNKDIMKKIIDQTLLSTE